MKVIDYLKYLNFVDEHLKMLPHVIITEIKQFVGPQTHKYDKGEIYCAMTEHLEKKNRKMRYAFNSYSKSQLEYVLCKWNVYLFDELRNVKSITSKHKQFSKEMVVDAMMFSAYCKKVDCPFISKYDSTGSWVKYQVHKTSERLKLDYEKYLKKYINRFYFLKEHVPLFPNEGKIFRLLPSSVTLITDDEEKNIIGILGDEVRYELIRKQFEYAIEPKNRSMTSGGYMRTVKLRDAVLTDCRGNIY